MTGTWKAILGCVLALGLLAGAVTYLESRLPRALHAQAEEEERLTHSELGDASQLQSQIRAQLKAHGEVLSATATREGWEETVDAAVAELTRIQGRYVGEVAEILARNQRDDEERLIALLDELFKGGSEAAQSISHLPARVKEIAELLPRAEAACVAFKTSLEREGERVASVEARVKELVAQGEGVEAIVARERWLAILGTCSEGLAKLEPQREALEALNAEHTVDASKRVLARIPSLERERATATAELQTLESRVQALADFLARRELYKRQLAGDLEALAGLAWKALAESTSAMAERYPFNSDEIKRRAVATMTPSARAERDGTAALAELQRPLAEVDPARVLRGVEAAAKARANGPGLITAFQAQLSSLDQSSEVVLIDMEITEGYEVNFRHLIRTSTATRGGAAPETKDVWKDVDEKAYKAREGLLGMTISTKPFGYFEDQFAAAPASPAGMAYVGNPAYGAWQNDTWVFSATPLCAALVASAWGTFYAPCPRVGYDAYAQRKAPWLGTDAWGHALYGSQGSLSAKIYASSRYLVNKGYANTKYKQTGGRYRGTKYERRATQSTTVFVGGTSSSSGRSSSSSYRSSSSSSSGYRSSSRSSTRTSSGK